MAQQPTFFTAYLETASGSGVVGGLTRKAYWAALTGTHLYLIEARVGAFKPMMENKGVRAIEREQIKGVHYKGNSLVIALAGGSELAFDAKPRPNLVSSDVAFCNQLLTHHGGTPVANQIQKNARIKTIVGVVFGLAIFGYYGYQMAYGGRAEVSVECGQKDGAVTCSVEHTYGGAEALACWDFVITCENRSHAVAHVCEDISSGQKEELVLSDSDFRGIEKCDAAADAALENIEVESL